MSFGFTGEQERFRRRIRDFLDREIKPGLKSAVNAQAFPRDLWRAIGRYGLLGIGLPGEYGGQPGNNMMRGIVAEELGKVDLSLAFALIPAYGTSLAILQGGSPEQKEALIPALITGDKLGSVAMTEPDCGSDLSRLRTKARREENHYVLTGEKSYVSWGLIADVNWVFAKTERDNTPAAATSFLLPLDLPGIIKTPFPQMGLQRLGHCALYFDDLPVPHEYLIGQEGKAFACAAAVFPHTRMILSLSALGSACITLEEALEFAKQRPAFGKSPAHREDVLFGIAEDATLLEGARCLCYSTLAALDRGERRIKEIAMGKWWSTEVAIRIISNAMNRYGHRGYDSSCPLEERLRDMIGYEIAEATPQILKLTICEEIFGKELRPFC